MTVNDIKNAISSGYLLKHKNFLDVCFLPLLILEETDIDLHVKGYWFSAFTSSMVSDHADYITIQKDLLDNWNVLSRR